MEKELAECAAGMVAGAIFFFFLTLVETRSVEIREEKPFLSSRCILFPSVSVNTFLFLLVLFVATGTFYAIKAKYTSNIVQSGSFVFCFLAVECSYVVRILRSRCIKESSFDPINHRLTLVYEGNEFFSLHTEKSLSVGGQLGRHKRPFPASALLSNAKKSLFWNNAPGSSSITDSQKLYSVADVLKGAGPFVRHFANAAKARGVIIVSPWLYKRPHRMTILFNQLCAEFPGQAIEFHKDRMGYVASLLFRLTHRSANLRHQSGLRLNVSGYIIHFCGNDSSSR